MTQRHFIQQDKICLVTAVTWKRMPIFGNPAHAREAIECLYRVQELHPFFIFGFVIMPDHCHFLILAKSPETVSKIMNVFKAGMTFNIGIPKLWQRRFHLRIPDKPQEALRYIHCNPMRAGIVQSPEMYPWSSASGQWDVAPMEL